MEEFVTLERAIACPRASAAVAADTAAHVLSAAGYRRGLGFGPTATYVRAYRPVWALVLAIVLAIPTLGLGLLFLLVRSKDHCNVVIEDGPYGVVALVAGRVPASLPAHLEAATGQYPQQSTAQGHAQMPPPMLLAPSGGQDLGSHPQAILRPATPVPPMDAPVPDPFAPPPGLQQPPIEPWQPPPAQSPQQPPQPHQPQHASAAPGRYPTPPVEPYPLQYAAPDNGRPEAPRLEPVEPGPPAPAPVAFRPPSRLAPPMPTPEPVAGAGANGHTPGPNGTTPPQPDDDPFSSTSGRVPWAVAGGRAAPMPAPTGPPPASPAAWSPNPVLPVPPAPVPTAPPAPVLPRGDASTGAAAQVGVGSVATAVGGQGYVLRVDSGETLELGPFCLLGREPVARDGDPPATLVRFDDVKLSVSKTHLAYGVDDTGLWVMDRNSTNGTTVIDSEGRRSPCAPGAREYVPIGSTVQIGQRRLAVEGPDDAASRG